MGIDTSFEPDTQLAEAGQPSMGTLDDSTMPTEPVVAFNATPGDTGCDSSLLERLPASRVVVAFVGMNLVWTPAWSPTFARNRCARGSSQSSQSSQSRRIHAVSTTSPYATFPVHRGPAHSRKRRQQVIPLPKPISCGKSSHGMPVNSTNKIPLQHNSIINARSPAFR